MTTTSITTTKNLGLRHREESSSKQEAPNSAKKPVFGSCKAKPLGEQEIPGSATEEKFPRTSPSSQASPQDGEEVFQEWRFKRFIDYCSILTFFITFLWAYYVTMEWDKPLKVFFYTIVGCVLSDAWSGVLHGTFDNIGSEHTPIFGKLFIKNFREHHVKPYKITEHDIVETNADSCLAMIPFTILLVLLQARGNFFACSIISACPWGALTNQIHKWAHQTSPPPLVQKLQSYNLILSREHHAKHHRGDFDTHYCITNGWVNRLFWR